MTKGLKGVGSLVEIGAVAIQSCPLMGKVYLTVEDGGIGIDLLVVVEHVSMDKVDARILDLGAACRALRLSLLGIGVKTGVAHQ